ncbi:aryl-sulfate sulfotransferase [Secundilactobacillus paracollinoides]|uniref:Thioredoxin n=2 Tax=Secundilactobacillus paracollinoides TaxID=240427 RepID=A0A1B2J161_9LACO|nr:aryl-sulfate sulfotransferase [Secundilactobacillus paracollinoides]ANZ62045.1 hypothetical protein AYR61_12240 [Secundilactobacillus paracollinoides]ANZ67990.1 hypothetical protein AYR63_13130 [Secundilactobacillus paracollinoides]KRL76554.1 thioredoxin [Secundilactobacillus paracollinoides DSM 15502 = JCM 11969]
MGFPTVYPTGTTVYNPEKANNGYTVITRNGKIDFIDMNGEVVVTKPARAKKGKIIVETRLVSRSQLSSLPVLDSQIIIKDNQGGTQWYWLASNHFTELGFNTTAENAIYRLIEQNNRLGWQKPWLKIEHVARLGKNIWFDGGDDRFDPENIIFSAPNANVVVIISHQTGQIVWKLGPTYDKFSGDQQFDWLINPTDAQLIDNRLPGAGNILIFDQGGAAGFGAVNGLSPDGIDNQHREYSRILEINPRTMTIEWQYTPEEAGNVQPLDSYKFYSPAFGKVQRLKNGNTIICEGIIGRIFEVTSDCDTVWEYLNPVFFRGNKGDKTNRVEWMTRIPYDQIDLSKPKETPVAQLNVTNLRVPGAPNGANTGKVTVVDGVDPHRLKAVRDPHAKQNLTKTSEHDFCVVTFGNASQN